MSEQHLNLSVAEDSNCRNEVTCSNCSKPIFSGEEYGCINGNVYCEECLDVMPLCVLIPMCGGMWLKVGEDK